MNAKHHPRHCFILNGEIEGQGRPDEGQIIKWHEGDSNQGCWFPGG